MKPLPLERDPVIEAYKKDVDRTLLRENLRRSVDERLEQLIAMGRWVESCRQSNSERRAEKNARP